MKVLAGKVITIFSKCVEVAESIHEKNYFAADFYFLWGLVCICNTDILVWGTVVIEICEYTKYVQFIN